MFGPVDIYICQLPSIKYVNPMLTLNEITNMGKDLNVDIKRICLLVL